MSNQDTTSESSMTLFVPVIVAGASVALFVLSLVLEVLWTYGFLMMSTPATGALILFAFIGYILRLLVVSVVQVLLLFFLAVSWRKVRGVSE